MHQVQKVMKSGPYPLYMTSHVKYWSRVVDMSNTYIYYTFWVNVENVCKYAKNNQNKNKQSLCPFYTSGSASLC